MAGPEKGIVYGEGRNGKDGLPATVTHTVEEIRDQAQIEQLSRPGPSGIVPADDGIRRRHRNH